MSPSLVQSVAQLCPSLRTEKLSFSNLAPAVQVAWLYHMPSERTRAGDVWRRTGVADARQFAVTANAANVSIPTACDGKAEPRVRPELREHSTRRPLAPGAGIQARNHKMTQRAQRQHNVNGSATGANETAPAGPGASEHNGSTTGSSTTGAHGEHNGSTTDGKAGLGTSSSLPRGGGITAENRLGMTKSEFPFLLRVADVYLAGRAGRPRLTSLRGTQLLRFGSGGRRAKRPLQNSIWGKRGRPNY